MWRIPLAAGLLAGLIACHEVVAVPPPDLSAGAQSMVLVQVDEAATTVHGVDLLAQPEGPRLTLRGDTQLYALTYGCPLDRLGLEPGLQAKAEPPAEAILLPNALSERQLDAVGGTDEWAVPATRPAFAQIALRSLPLSREVVCASWPARFEPVDSTLPNDGHGLAALTSPLGDGTALVASREGYFYRVLPSGEVRTLPQLIPGQPRAAHLMDDGTLWLLDSEGSLYRGTIESGFVRAARGPGIFGGDVATFMSGPTDPAVPFELFAATSAKAFARFDGASWTISATAAPDFFFLPRVIWLGPEHAVTFKYGPQRDILEYDHGELRGSDLPGDADPAGVGWVPELGLVVGSLGGNVYVKTDGQWRNHGTDDYESFTHLMLPLPGRGMLVGGLTERRQFKFGFGQWLPDLGYCPPQQLSSPVAGIAAVDDRTYVLITVTSLTENQAFDIDMIRMTDPPSSCSGS